MGNVSVYNNDMRDRHEGDFKSICDLCDDVRLGEEAKEFLLDGVGERGDEKAESGHLKNEVSLN
jgi:hypothetical protein